MPIFSELQIRRHKSSVLSIKFAEFPFCWKSVSMSDSEDNSSTPASNKKHQRHSAMATQRQSSLNDSLRKRQPGPLNKTFYTVQKEDGDIGTIEVSVTDETFSTQQPILQSLAEMGEISTPPPERKNKLKVRLFPVLSSKLG